jgi:prolyl oligopeptidase PreP (S9A serine peptidase family)
MSRFSALTLSLAIDTTKPRALQEIIPQSKDTKARHEAGKPTSKRIEESADRWAFLVKELKMQPKS